MAKGAFPSSEGGGNREHLSSAKAAAAPVPEKGACVVERDWIVQTSPDYVEPPSYSWNWWLYQDLFADDRRDPKMPVALWQLAMVMQFKRQVRVTERQAQDAMEYAATVHNWPSEPPYPIEAFHVA